MGFFTQSVEYTDRWGDKRTKTVLRKGRAAASYVPQKSANTMIGIVRVAGVIYQTLCLERSKNG